MKLSLATLSVLLSTASVQALPPPLTHKCIKPDEKNCRHVFLPPGPQPLKARAEDLGAAGVPTVGDITAQVSNLIKAAQDPDDDWEDKEKTLRGLEESRKLVTERLLYAQTEQKDAELHLRTEDDLYDDAQKKTTELKQAVDELNKEKVELEKSLNATESKLSEAKQDQYRRGYHHNKALKARKDAVDRVKALRETIAQLDDAIKNIGENVDG